MKSILITIFLLMPVVVGAGAMYLFRKEKK